MRTAVFLFPILAVVGSCGKDKKPEPIVHDTPPTVVDASVVTPDAPPACSAPTPGMTVALRQIGSVTGPAMLATSPPGDSRLFVVENSGGIRIFDQQQLLPTKFLDISDDAGGKVLAGGEQGLLGLAFHPNYAVNRQFYVFYTASNPSLSDPNPYVNVVERYTTSATDPNVADPTSATPILSISDFASNHNGGMIEFGSDGFLYIGTGDGGGGGDPRRFGQDPNALLGKILRIDVDNPANGKPYGIPAGNPFATSGGAPEIFILGLRNPWRWSFDRGTGDMWIGDVGQGRIEEIDWLEAGQQAGKNLGWSVYEGNLCCANSGDVNYKCSQTGTLQPCDLTGKTPPVDSRLAADGWRAIIGGQVYRGACYPDLAGWYFYSDNSKHGLHRARPMANKTLEIVDLPGTWPNGPASIHADARGELFMTTTTGGVYALEVTP